MTQPAPGVTPDLFWETMTGFQRSAVLKTAVELEVFTKMGEGNATAADIAAACGASERGVRILCDSLATMGFLTKSGDKYGMTESTAVFLDKKSRAYVGSALDFILAPQQRRGFDDLTNAVTKGGSSITGDASMDPESTMWVTFANGMAPLMFPVAQMTAEHLDLATDRPLKILDIAAGHGLYGIMAGQKYPNAQIYGADWANVLTVAQENAAKFGMSDRYHTVPGDAFESDLGSGYDAILVPNFFHHVDKEACENFIRKLDASLAEGGKIATVEFIPNEDRISPPTSAMFAVVMLAATPAGDAYTFSEFKKMFENAGFTNNQLFSLEPMPSHLIISTH